MPAIVGAGPGLDLSIAKVFGRHGFDVALISRNEEKLAGLVKELAGSGVAAAAFPADTSDRAQLASALEAAATRFGRIDVLEYSPYAGLVRTAPQDVTVEELQPQIDEILHGAVTATQTVLPAMLEAGAGTLLYTLGGGDQPVSLPGHHEHRPGRAAQLGPQPQHPWRAGRLRRRRGH
jgi:NADP-dependent 3-hydroxy acid dehydrogenase YdfG